MISVCIATYNGEKYIEEQLKSILSQLGEKDEIIVSDDNSTDKTIDIIESMNDLRIKVFKNEHLKGVVYNFENAIKKSEGEYIFLSDQDDIWLGDKINEIVPLLIEYDCVVHDAYLVDDILCSSGKTVFEILSSKKGILKNLYKNTYVGCCMAFRSNIKNNILPFPKRIPMHDSWIGMISDKYGKVFFLNKQLIKYRRHDLSISNTAGKSNQRITRRILSRLYLALWLLKR